MLLLEIKNIWNRFTLRLSFFAVDNNIYKHDKSFDKYNVLSGDGTKFKTSYRNKKYNGKNIVSIIILAVYDIFYKTLRDYKIAYDCNEHTTLLEHNLTKQYLIILDRYYAALELFTILKLNCLSE